MSLLRDGEEEEKEEGGRRQRRRAPPGSTEVGVRAGRGAAGGPGGGQRGEFGSQPDSERGAAFPEALGIGPCARAAVLANPASLMVLPRSELL